jgi:sensor domain CHASE-containing protein
MNDQRKPTLGPRWLPIPIALLVLAASIGMWRELSLQQQAHFQRMLASEAAAIESRIASHFDTETFALVRMAKQWEYWGKDFKDIWIDDVEQYVEQHAGYRAISASVGSSGSPPGVFRNGQTRSQRRAISSSLQVSTTSGRLRRMRWK